jgi:hypothetical protein
MPLVGFELTILVFERAKTVHASDPAAYVIGKIVYYGNLLPVTKYPVRGYERESKMLSIYMYRKV